MSAEWAWAVRIFALLLCCAATFAASANEPRIAQLGTCPLANGQVIQDCRVGYVTAGTLNSDKSNAILIPSWLGGRSADLLRYVGPDKLFDSDRFFIVLVDSFGNGVSSSPSNSKRQPGAAFPQVTLLDMVAAYRKMLEQEFGVKTLHAMAGISMGGMQTFAAAVAHPDLASRYVSIAGSPRLAPYDIVLWETQLRLHEEYLACQCTRPLEVLAGMRFLLRGPDYQAQHAPHAKLAEVRAGIARQSLDRGQAYNRNLQLKAMIDLDVTRAFSGDLAVAAKRVKAPLLVVTGGLDNIVTPQPAREFAKLAGAEALHIHECDHGLPACATDSQYPVVRAFLAR
ncbi:MAG: alpha/beta fold hydrolase [Burkholderiales bacterium]|nr:alpha/beta fold hydrolase [Burkholderiales bacterium]